MKVKELIKILEKKDKELEVILQKDSEGNGYSPLYQCWPGYYISDSSYSGEGYNIEDIEDKEYMENEGVKALFLEPIN